jgi:hypothetical protein
MPVRSNIRSPDAAPCLCRSALEQRRIPFEVAAYQRIYERGGHESAYSSLAPVINSSISLLCLILCPSLPTCAVQQVGGCLRYSGRAVSVVAEAAHDPKETWRIAA